MDYNVFDDGIMLGKFYISWHINELFCGVNVRLGLEHLDTNDTFALTMQLGYGQLSIGFIK